jgi:hypothetical protein
LIDSLGKWDCATFEEKVGTTAPTLTVLEVAPGIECAALAVVPILRAGRWNSDPERKGAVFSLSPWAARFDLKSDDHVCQYGGDSLCFGDYDLSIRGNHSVRSDWSKRYAGPRRGEDLLGPEGSRRQFTRCEI